MFQENGMLRFTGVDVELVTFLASHLPSHVHTNRDRANLQT